MLKLDTYKMTNKGIKNPEVKEEKPAAIVSTETVKTVIEASPLQKSLIEEYLKLQTRIEVFKGQSKNVVKAMRAFGYSAEQIDAIRHNTYELKEVA